MVNPAPQIQEQELLSRTLWLGVPIGLFIAQLVSEFTLPQKVQARLITENGPLEFVQFYVLIIAAVLAILCLKACWKSPDMLLKIWFGLALAGCLYTAGEEISWGQHLFGWGTPEGWGQINDQQETNLHNTSAWLDQKPRLILELGVIFGGIILPLTAKKIVRGKLLWLGKIIPPRTLMITAFAYVTAKLLDKFGDLSGFVILKRASEVTELYIYYFVLLYLLAMLRLYSQGQQNPVPAESGS